MGFGESVKHFFGFGPEDDDDAAYEGGEGYGEGDDLVFQRDRDADAHAASADDAGARKSGGSNKVVNINTTTQLQVVLVKPERFTDASAIADHLNAKRTVVLNLESTNREVARRLVDFLSGVAYANNGEMKRVANSTFIITPFNVDIMGDILDELESSGVFC